MSRRQIEKDEERKTMKRKKFFSVENLLKK